MTSQVLSAQSSSLSAWVGLLRGHAALTRELNARLVTQHGLTINDFEALYHLAHSEDKVMRRVDLAERLLLTPSGVTRLLDGLERAGLVGKATCATDLRVTYAVLTDAGRERLENAAATHFAAIDALFDGLSEEELDTLATLLGRLPGAGDTSIADCTEA